MAEGKPIEQEKTLEDVIVSNTLCTDRIEMAIENMTTQQRKWTMEIIRNMPSGRGGTPSLIGPGKYDDKLIMIEHAVTSVKETMFAIIAVIIVAGVMIMLMFSWLISSVQHIQNGSYVPEKGDVQIELDDDISGSEQNTSTEAEASPEKPDQSSQQSSSGGPQPD